MAYNERNPWTDKSIIAQVAAKCAADVCQTLQEVTVEVFREWQKAIYDNTLQLVGEPPAVAAAPAGHREGHGSPQQAGGGGSPRNDGSLPYGNTEIKFGKHKGSTIADIDSTDTQYLEWLGGSTDNEFLAKAINGYLKAKGQGAAQHVEEAF